MSDRIYLSVKVQPKARKRKVERLSSSEYKVSVLSPPSRGKANREVIEVLAAYFDLPLSQIKILRGEKSRQKLILIDMNDRRISRFGTKKGQS